MTKITAGNQIFKHKYMIYYLYKHGETMESEELYVNDWTIEEVVTRPDRRPTRTALL